MATQFDSVVRGLILQGKLYETHADAHGEVQTDAVDSSKSTIVDIQVGSPVGRDGEQQIGSLFCFNYLLLYGKMIPYAFEHEITIQGSVLHTGDLTSSTMSVPHPIFSISDVNTPINIRLINTTKFIQPYDFTLLQYVGRQIDRDLIMKTLIEAGMPVVNLSQEQASNIITEAQPSSELMKLATQQKVTTVPKKQPIKVEIQGRFAGRPWWI